jgi:hypothetical protein
MEQTSSSNHQNSGSSAQGSQAKEQAKQQTQQVAQRTEQKAGQVAHQARQKAKDQLATQKERAAGTLDGVAQALRQTGQHLREQDQGPVGRYADRAADQVERFSSHLHERDVDQLTGEAENFARKRPALFLGGTFALGLLGARFLKSSSGQGSGSSQHGSSSGGDGSAGVPAATSGTVPYGTGETDATALPPRTLDEEPRTLQTPSERTEPPRGS